MSHYPMLYKYGKRKRDFLGRFIFYLALFSILIGGVLIKQLFHLRLLDMS